MPAVGAARSRRNVRSGVDYGDFTSGTGKIVSSGEARHAGTDDTDLHRCLSQWDSDNLRDDCTAVKSNDERKLYPQAMACALEGKRFFARG